MSFIRRWVEGLDIPGPDLGPVGAEDVDEGVVLGNLGAKVVGTLVDWVGEGGFLVRVKNADVLMDGIGRLRDVVLQFNRVASRLVARSSVGSRGLQDLQKRWFFTLGSRLSEMGKGGSVGQKALEQLVLLAPKLEAYWSKYIVSDEAQNFGLRVTNPEIVGEPTGAPEDAGETGAAGMEQPVSGPGVMDGAPQGPGLGVVPGVGIRAD